MVFKKKVFNGFQSQVEEHLVFVKIDYFAKTMSLTSVPPSGRTPGLTMVFKNKVFSGFQSQVGEHLNSQWFSKTRFSIVFKAKWENTWTHSGFQTKVFNSFQSHVGKHLVFVKTIFCTSVPPSGRTPDLFNVAIEARGHGKCENANNLPSLHWEHTVFFPTKKKEPQNDIYSK